MVRQPDNPSETPIREIEVEPRRDGYQPVTLSTDRGKISCRYCDVPDTRRGVIYVGGIGGDWDTPAKGLYPRLCQELVGESIASLRVRFRHPTNLDESVFDVLAGLRFLQTRGIDAVALVGHSFGGAVVVQAAATASAVRTVVTLATQGQGTKPVSRLAPYCSILLIHGTADRVLSPANSELVSNLAHEPKRLVLFERAGHGLDEVADAVHQIVHDWLVERLNEAPSQASPP